jgi:hypothetical protein
VDTLPVVPSLTGFVTNHGAVSANTNPTAGDFDQLDTNRIARGFVTFDLSGVPAGVTLKTANMRLYQRTITGDPYLDHGSIVIDHVLLGPTLDDLDYLATALDTSFAVVAADQSPGIKLVNILSAVRADLTGGRASSQFRLRFSVKEGNNNGIDDNVVFKSHLEFPPPLVIITY